jgi:hypothetical protein
MPTRLILNWGHKHIGDTVRNILSISHQQSPSNKSKRKEKEKDAPQTQLIDWLDYFKSTKHHKCRTGQ